MSKVDSRLRKIVAELLPIFYKNLENPRPCPKILSRDVCHVSVVCLERVGFGRVYSYVSFLPLKAHRNLLMAAAPFDVTVSCF